MRITSPSRLVIVPPLTMVPQTWSIPLSSRYIARRILAKRRELRATKMTSGRFEESSLPKEIVEVILGTRLATYKINGNGPALTGSGQRDLTTLSFSDVSDTSYRI